MFVGVARLVLEIPGAGSLKTKRQVLRRVVDRLQARFNLSVAEVDNQDAWQRATVALAVVGNDRRHVNEQLDKAIHCVEELYVAPLLSREMEIIGMGDSLGSGTLTSPPSLPIETGHRSLAEAEGLGDWETRVTPVHRSEGKAHRGKKLPLEEARAKARSLRNLREWEKE